MSESLMNARFKVLGYDRQSHHGGNGTWRKNQWRSVKGKIVPCQNGIHYCKPEHLVRWLGPTIWLFEDDSPEETIDAGDKMVTRKGRIVEQVETWNERTARLFAADVAELALVYIPEAQRDPFVAAIDAARGFARGEVSDKERAAAGDASGDASSAAASAAARAASSAASSAAAWDASSAAASAAARAASSAASSAAAWAASRAAAWAAQTTILFEYLDGTRS